MLRKTGLSALLSRQGKGASMRPQRNAAENITFAGVVADT